MLARSIVVGCRSIVVAGRFVGTSGHLVLVANAVFVRVIHTTTIAVLSFRRVFARGVRTVACAVATDGQVQSQEVDVVTLREDLDIQVARQFSVGGELTQQYRSIGFGETVGVSIQDVPNPTDLVVDDDVPSRKTIAGLEPEAPILVGRIHNGRGSLSRCSARGSFQADGDPAVEREFRETRQEQRIYIFRCRSTQDVLVEVGGRVQVKWLIDVAIYRSHEVRGVFSVEVNPVGRHARQGAGGVLFHGAQLQTVSAIRRWWRVWQCVGIVVASLRIVTGLFLHIVADAIGIHILRAVTTADTDGIELVPIAVAIARGDVGTSACINGARTVADTTGIKLAHAIVHVIAHAVSVGVGRAIATAHADCVGLVAIAITVAGRNAVTAANAALIELVAIAVAVAGWNATAAANAARVNHIAIAITIACGNAVATANAALVHHGTGAVVIGSIGIVVARRGVRATGHFVLVANAVFV